MFSLQSILLLALSLMASLAVGYGDSYGSMSKKKNPKWCKKYKRAARYVDRVVESYNEENSASLSPGNLMTIEQNAQTVCKDEPLEMFDLGLQCAVLRNDNGELECWKGAFYNDYGYICMGILGIDIESLFPGGRRLQDVDPNQFPELASEDAYTEMEDFFHRRLSSAGEGIKLQLPEGKEDCGVFLNEEDGNPSTEKIVRYFQYQQYCEGVFETEALFGGEVPEDCFDKFCPGKTEPCDGKCDTEACDCDDFAWDCASTCPGQSEACDCSSKCGTDACGCKEAQECCLPKPPCDITFEGDEVWCDEIHQELLGSYACSCANKMEFLKCFSGTDQEKMAERLDLECPPSYIIPPEFASNFCADWIINEETNALDCNAMLAHMRLDECSRYKSECERTQVVVCPQEIPLGNYLAGPEWEDFVCDCVPYGSSCAFVGLGVGSNSPCNCEEAKGSACCDTEKLWGDL